jgi:ribosomal protein S18 acetylase RimI-like enzyme
MNIRRAKKADIQEIIKLNLRLIDYHKKLDRHNKNGNQVRTRFEKVIKEQIGKKNEIYFIAEESDFIVGYLYGEIVNGNFFRKYDKIGHIGHVFIDEKYRKREVGKSLFKEFVKWCKNKKIRHIELSVHAKNQLGIDVWKKFGFKPYEITMERNL